MRNIRQIRRGSTPVHFHVYVTPFQKTINDSGGSCGGGSGEELMTCNAGLRRYWLSHSHSYPISVYVTTFLLKKTTQLNLAAILIFDKCNKLQLEQLSIKTYTGHWMLTGCLTVSQPAPHFPPGITFVNSFSSVKSFWLSDFLEFFTVCWNPSARVRLWQCLLHASLLSFLELKSEDAEQEIKTLKIFLNSLILIFSSIFI